MGLGGLRPAWGLGGAARWFRARVAGVRWRGARWGGGGGGGRCGAGWGVGLGGVQEGLGGWRAIEGNA